MEHGCIVLSRIGHTDMFSELTPTFKHTGAYLVTVMYVSFCNVIGRVVDGLKKQLGSLRLINDTGYETAGISGTRYRLVTHCREHGREVPSFIKDIGFLTG